MKFILDMGVPAFFRWLSRKYGSIVVDAVEEKRRDVDGIKIPIDATKPNPNFQVIIFLCSGVMILYLHIILLLIFLGI